MTEKAIVSPNCEKGVQREICRSRKSFTNWQKKKCKSSRNVVWVARSWVQKLRDVPVSRNYKAENLPGASLKLIFEENHYRRNGFLFQEKILGDVQSSISCIKRVRIRGITHLVGTIWMRSSTSSQDVILIGHATCPKLSRTKASHDAYDDALESLCNLSERCNRPFLRGDDDADTDVVMADCWVW